MEPAGKINSGFRSKTKPQNPAENKGACGQNEL